MFTFNSDALAQLFHETYHQAMSVRLVICSQEGLFLEFRNGLPGQLFYRKERIYALEYSGGSADPGVQVELNFGQISETYALTVDDPTFFSPITPADKVVVLSVRSTYQLKRKTISWLSQHKLGLFRERMDLMRTADFVTAAATKSGPGGSVRQLQCLKKQCLLTVSGMTATIFIIPGGNSGRD